VRWSQVVPRFWSLRNVGRLFRSCSWKSQPTLGRETTLLDILAVEWTKVWRRPLEHRLATSLFALALVLPPILVSFTHLPGGEVVRPCLPFPNNLNCAASLLNRWIPLAGAVLGASAMGSEFSACTIGSLVALSGERRHLFVAKALVLCGYGVVTAAVALSTWVGSSTLCSLSLAGLEPAPVLLPDAVAASIVLLLSLTVYGVLGLVGATLTRSEVGGVLVGVTLQMFGGFPASGWVRSWLPQHHIANVGCRLSASQAVRCTGASGISESLWLLLLFTAVMVTVGCAILNRVDLD
jgi:hypothetical protein